MADIVKEKTNIADFKKLEDKFQEIDSIVEKVELKINREQKLVEHCE